MEYPKWIDHPTENRAMTADMKRIPLRVLVQNEKEEASYYPKEDKKEEKKEDVKEPKWPPKK